MRKFAMAAAFALLTGLVSAGLAAADHHEEKAEAPTRPDLAAFLFIYDDAAQKLQSLAEAIPAEKYAWRPAEGVRSIGEAFVHAGASIYLIAGFAGAPLPEAAPKGVEGMLALEKSADKKSVQALLGDTLAYGRKVAIAATPEMLDKPVDFFGNAIDGRTIFLLLAAHLHEHLGQEIAYARSNGVTPPWSQQPAKSE